MGVALVVCAGGAQAAKPITFSMCEDVGGTLSFRQPAGTDELIVSCSRTGEVVLTLKGCIGPRVKRAPEGRYSVTCDKMKPYRMIPAD